MTPGALTAQFAALAECGVKPWEFDQLTPYQVSALYFHPRNEDGTIKAPAAPAGAPIDQAARIGQLIALKDAFGIKPDVMAELQRRLETARNGQS